MRFSPDVRTAPHQCRTRMRVLIKEGRDEGRANCGLRNEEAAMLLRPVPGQGDQSPVTW